MQLARWRKGFRRYTISHMKLVIATPLYPPEVGGPATYAKLLKEKLPVKNVEVKLIKFDDVRRFPKVFRHLVFFWHIIHAIHHADLVLALDPVSTGLPTCLAAWITRKPFIVKIVGDYAWEQGQQRFGITTALDEFVKEKRVPCMVWFFRRVQFRVASSAKCIIVPSEYLKNIVAAWGIKREKIRIIYNAVSLEEHGSVPESVVRLPRPLVVTAGRLVPWKHIDGVIDAVAHVSGVSLAIIGDGPERAALMRRADEKLSKRSIFTGMLSHEDMLAVLKSADVFILNSSYEGLSHLLIEAQMLGVLTIATDVGGNPEIIKDGDNGLLVSFDNTQALAAAIKRIFSNKELRTHLSARAVESARRFSTEAMLSATLTALKNI